MWIWIYLDYSYSRAGSFGSRCVNHSKNVMKSVNHIKNVKKSVNHTACPLDLRYIPKSHVELIKLQLQFGASQELDT